MRIISPPAALAAMGLFAACHEPTAEPARPLFSAGAAATCPTPSNVTVTNEADLRAALSAATPGEVIGLDGFFSVTADVIIGTPDDDIRRYAEEPVQPDYLARSRGTQSRAQVCLVRDGNVRGSGTGGGRTSGEQRSGGLSGWLVTGSE